MKKQKTLRTAIMIFATGFLVSCIVKEVSLGEEQPLTEEPLRPKVEYAIKKPKNVFKDYIETEETINARNQANTHVSTSDSALIEAPVIPPHLEIGGIIWGGDLPLAIINNKVLKIGDIIEGAKIKDINEYGFSLVFKGRLFKFSLGKTRKEPQGGNDEK